MYIVLYINWSLAAVHKPRPDQVVALLSYGCWWSEFLNVCVHIISVSAHECVPDLSALNNTAMVS